MLETETLTETCYWWTHVVIKSVILPSRQKRKRRSNNVSVFFFDVCWILTTAAMLCYKWRHRFSSLVITSAFLPLYIKGCGNVTTKYISGVHSAWMIIIYLLMTPGFKAFTVRCSESRNFRTSDPWPLENTDFSKIYTVYYGHAIIAGEKLGLFKNLDRIRFRFQ